MRLTSERARVYLYLTKTSSSSSRGLYGSRCSLARREGERETNLDLSRRSRVMSLVGATTVIRQDRNNGRVIKKDYAL